MIYLFLNTCKFFLFLSWLIFWFQKHRKWSLLEERLVSSKSRWGHQEQVYRLSSLSPKQSPQITRSNPWHQRVSEMYLIWKIINLLLPTSNIFVLKNYFSILAASFVFFADFVTVESALENCFLTLLSESSSISWDPWGFVILQDCLRLAVLRVILFKMTDA